MMNSPEQPKQTVEKQLAERESELEDARNALKKVVAGITPEQLIAMSDSVTTGFVIGCGGNVDKYIQLKMDANAGNEPNVAKYHVTEELNRIREYLESKK